MTSRIRRIEPGPVVQNAAHHRPGSHVLPDVKVAVK